MQKLGHMTAVEFRDVAASEGRQARRETVERYDLSQGLVVNLETTLKENGEVTAEDYDGEGEEEAEEEEVPNLG